MNTNQTTAGATCHGAPAVPHTSVAVRPEGEAGRTATATSTTLPASLITAELRRLRNDRDRLMRHNNLDGLELLHARRLRFLRLVHDVALAEQSGTDQMQVAS